MPSQQQIHGEEAIVQEFLAPLAAGYPGALALKDDCAAITPAPGHDIVVKTDPIAEGVHFLAKDAPEHIAWKALAVNVSDLAAKAAVPRAYLMALSFPEPPTRDWMQRFAKGLADAQAAFGMHLIGGDTDRRPGPITISITVFGEVATGTMIRRGSARPGDRIFVSGTLGAAAIGLALRLEEKRDALSPHNLMARWGYPETELDSWSRVIDASIRPQPRLGLREALCAHATAAMDISDGLAKDLGRMARASGCAAEVALAKLPLEPIVRAAVTAEPERWNEVVAGGDDYEILAAVPPEEAQAFVKAVNLGGLAVTEIGAFLTGEGLSIIGLDGRPLCLARTGWDHF